MGSAADYPYDPALDVSKVKDLEKLRCVPDREQAQQLYELWFQCSPDTPQKQPEVYDPGTYGDFEPEPDLNDLHNADVVRDEQDRAQACVHYALIGFYRGMAEREQEMGRKYTRPERSAHENRFKARLLATYGYSGPTSNWLARKADWDSRTTRGNGSREGQ